MGCGCFLPCLLLRGVAWLPLGGVLGGATFPLSSVVVRCCVLGRVLGGWHWRWCLVVECWVVKRKGGVWGCSVSGLVMGLQACFLVWDRITMKTTLTI